MKEKRKKNSPRDVVARTVKNYRTITREATIHRSRLTVLRRIIGKNTNSRK